MIGRIIPSNRRYATIYSLVATAVVVAQLFSLDKTIQLEELKQVEYFGLYVLIASFITILSLVYANGLKASPQLIRISRVCLLLAPLLWFALVILGAYYYGAKFGALGVYVPQIRNGILIFMAIFAYQIYAKANKS